MLSIKALKEKASKLEEDLPTLTQAVQTLSTEANLMRRFENDLGVIASQQGYANDYVVDLVVDNDMTLEKIKVIGNASFLFKLCSCFISQRLIFYSSVQINLRMVTVYYIAKVFFNEDINVSLERIRVLVLHLKHELNPRGIEVESEMLEDLVTRRGIYGLLQFCSKFLFSSIDKYERGDEMEMFSLQRMYTRGSVRIARGLKPILADINSHQPQNAVLRRVQAELALRVSSMKGQTPTMPTEIIIEPDIVEETTGVVRLNEQLVPEYPSQNSPRSGKKRIRLKSLEAFEDVNPVLNELPDAPMSLMAEYLCKSQRVLLCVAMSAPMSSWEKHQWKVEPHSATKTILSAKLSEEDKKIHRDRDPSLEPWQFLDLKLVSPYLTDTLLGGMLVCIDAVHNLKKLYLTHCFKVTGSGLEVLRHSTVIEQIDLSLVDTHERPALPNEAHLSVDIVVPILNFMIENSNSLKQVQISKRWQEDRRPLLSQFLSRFDSILHQRNLICSLCGDTCQPNVASPIVIQRGENYGVQSYICYKCLKNVCSEPEHNFDFCSKCKKNFCSNCNPVMRCQECQEMTCQMCTQVQSCDECHRVTCAECVPVVYCEFCKRSRCMDCAEYLMCSDDTCGKINCFECAIPGDPRFVHQCVDCEEEFCGTCDPLEECEDDGEEYCIDCHKARCNRTELRAELRRRSQEGDSTRPKCWRMYERPNAGNRNTRRRS